MVAEAKAEAKVGVVLVVVNAGAKLSAGAK